MNPHLSIRTATVEDAYFIARGFHTAMLYEDVDDDRLRIFAEHICRRKDVLYSWCNTYIALWNGEQAGMITAYDGSRYRAMREITMALISQHLGTSFPGMEDECGPGEYYLDSLAVMPEFRQHGIGRALLTHAIEQGIRMGLNVTLAVDPVNDKAQRLYESLGFMDAGTLFIFGHTYGKMQILRHE